MARANRWSYQRFDSQTQDPMAPMANFVDIMLVFACGLIAVIVANNGGLMAENKQAGQEIKKGQEIPQLPSGLGEAGSGFESIGQVYKDSKTGKMILINRDND